MHDKLTKAFQKAKYKTSVNLEENIWLKLTTREKHFALFKLWAFASLGFASLAGLIPAFKIMLSDLTQSGFYEYFSLIFSDGLTNSVYWKELSLSLAESLPAISIILTLSLVFISFLSIRYFIKTIINNDSLGQAFGIA